MIRFRHYYEGARARRAYSYSNRCVRCGGLRGRLSLFCPERQKPSTVSLKAYRRQIGR